VHPARRDTAWEKKSFNIQPAVAERWQLIWGAPQQWWPFNRPDTPTAQLVELSPISRRPGEVPSLVWDNGDQPLIGRQVIEAGLDDSDDPKLHRDFKRLIGPEDTPEHNRACWAGQQLLREVWKRLPQGLNIERLVLSAPVESYRTYRSWLLQASDALPVQEIALVDEPTGRRLGRRFASRIADVGRGSWWQHP
jgi:hypothetical protein